MCCTEAQTPELKRLAASAHYTIYATLLIDVTVLLDCVDVISVMAILY